MLITVLLKYPCGWLGDVGPLRVCGSYLLAQLSRGGGGGSCDSVWGKGGGL